MSEKAPVPQEEFTAQDTLSTPEVQGEVQGQEEILSVEDASESFFDKVFEAWDQIALDNPDGWLYKKTVGQLDKVGEKIYEKINPHLESSLDSFFLSQKVQDASLLLAGFEANWAVESALNNDVQGAVLFGLASAGTVVLPRLGKRDVLRVRSEKAEV